jgi:hypothetical protein
MAIGRHVAHTHAQDWQDHGIIYHILTLLLYFLHSTDTHGKRSKGIERKHLVPGTL